MFPHKAFWPSVNLSWLQPVVKLCMCNLFFLLPSRLPRWGAACWSTCLQSLPNFFGCKAVDRKDGPSKSTVFTLETEKAVGIQHLAEKLRLSQAMSAGLLNNMRILVQWYGYFFFQLLEQNMWWLSYPSPNHLKNDSQWGLCLLFINLIGWGGFVSWVIRTLDTGVTLQFLCVQM